MGMNRTGGDATGIAGTLALASAAQRGTPRRVDRRRGAGSPSTAASLERPTASRIGGRQCVPRQTQPTRPGAGAAPLTSAGGTSATPARLNTRTSGRYVALERALPRARTSPASPASSDRRRRREQRPRAPPAASNSRPATRASARREQPHRALGGLDVARLAGEVAERDQRLRRDAVARRRRVVVARAWSGGTAARDRGS